MKLLVQRVLRATVEVDGFVEARIGAGLVLSLALRQGDTVQQATALASKVVRLKLWSAIADVEQLWKTSVVENGYEVLVLLQPSLLSTFAKLEPSDQVVMDDEESKGIFDAFVTKLQAEYQEEMVVSAALEATTRVEMTTEGGRSVFELDAPPDSSRRELRPRTPPRGQPNRSKAVTTPPGSELGTNIAPVTKALRRIAQMAGSKATVESSRIFRIFGLKNFQASLAAAGEADADAFTEALEAAAGFFSEKQQEQITAWTGLPFVGLPSDATVPHEADAVQQYEDGEEAAEGDQDDDDLDLDAQLAELKREVENPPAAKRSLPTSQPDWTGRAAPNTPAAPSRYASANRGAGQLPSWGTKGPKGKGKGKGKGGPRPQRSLGIVSLDESARLHGNSSKDYRYNQQARYSDRDLHFTAAGEAPETAGAKRQRLAAGTGAGPTPTRQLPKGMPTLAPMCPAPAESDEAGEEL